MAILMIDPDDACPWDVPWLTPEQISELCMFARRHGPAWTERLRAAWEDRSCPEGLVLRELRGHARRALAEDHPHRRWMAAMSAVEMIDTEDNYPAGMDIPIYGQQMRLFDCQSVLGNDIGYPFEAAAFAELCENIERLERHRAVLAPSIDEPWRTHAIVNVAAVGIRRLDLKR